MYVVQYHNQQTSDTTYHRLVVSGGRCGVVNDHSTSYNQPDWLRITERWPLYNWPLLSPLLATEPHLLSWPPTTLPQPNHRSILCNLPSRLPSPLHHWPYCVRYVLYTVYAVHPPLISTLLLSPPSSRIRSPIESTILSSLNNSPTPLPTKRPRAPRFAVCYMTATTPPRRVTSSQPLEWSVLASLARL